MFRIIMLFVLFISLSAHAGTTPSAFRITAVNTRTNKEIKFGSAVLIGKNTGCFATSQHFTAFAQVPHTELFIIHESKRYMAHIRLEQGLRDAAVVCIDSPLPELPEAAVYSNSDCGPPYSAKGFPTYAVPKQPYGTPRFRSLSLQLLGNNPPTAQFAQYRENLIKELQAHGVPSPEISPPGEDLIVMQLRTPNDWGKELYGLSGGGLFDGCGHLRGIITMHSIQDSLLFTAPLDQIPQNFFQ